jgi:L-threonylcarbamoyladenylate synthase
MPKSSLDERAFVIAVGDTPSGLSGAELERAAFALVVGRVIGIPTDTVYGLAADPARAGAADALFALKGRPKDLELPVLVADAEQAAQLARRGLTGRAATIASRFWPGAVTIVVARNEHISWNLGGDPSSIGLRCPADPVAQWLCSRVGPLATTSANRHGRPPLATACEVASEFGDGIAMVLDTGRLEGSPSTVVDVREDRLRCIREGAVPYSEIESAVG